ncbi:MAG: hypothetical protein WBC91_22180 [Phototrophicaceae bacterium]
MAQDSQANRPTCYIEFRIHDPERFTLLGRFFTPLREYSQTIDPSEQSSYDDVTAQGIGTLLSGFADTQEARQFVSKEDTKTRGHFAKPEEWLLALRPQDLDMLNMPAHRDAILALREWQGLSRRERRKAIKSHENSRQLRGLADFMDMLKYWQDIEFELVELQQTDPDRARIRYRAFSYPFKGKVALEELLMFFGFLSILRDSC